LECKNKVCKKMCQKYFKKDLINPNRVFHKKAG